MSRSIAFVCNDLSLTPKALGSLRSKVRMGDTAGSGGYGFAWFQGKQTLLRTTPRPQRGSAEFLDVMADLPTRAAIGQIRDPEDGFVDAQELQPIRFRNWIFAHGGTQAEEPHRAELEASIPGFLAGKRRGTSFGELVGHVFFGQLHRRNLLDGRHESGLLAEALAEAVRVIMAGGVLPTFGLMAITKGTLLAARFGRPMHFGEIRGITVEKEAPLFAGHKPKTVEHARFRALALTDAPLSAEAEDWLEIPDRHVLCVNDDWEKSFQQI